MPKYTIPVSFTDYYYVVVEADDVEKAGEAAIAYLANEQDPTDTPSYSHSDGYDYDLGGADEADDEEEAHTTAAEHGL